MKDYKIHIEPDTFHAYPVFTFTPEGRKGEQQVIDYINAFFRREISDRNAQNQQRFPKE